MIAAGFMPDATKPAAALSPADRAAVANLAAWRPRTPGTWKQTATSQAAGADSLGCFLTDGPTWTAKAVTARLSWVQCEDASQSTFVLGTHGAALQRLDGSVFGQADQAYEAADGSISRTWAQGPFALNLETVCSGLAESACLQLNGTEARGARSLLPEAPEQRSQWFSEFLVTLLISGPFAAWFVLVLPIRFFAWLAQPRYRSLRAGNRYGDLTWATRRATAWRVVRRLLSIAAGLTVLSFLGPAPRAAVGRALTTGVLIATPILAAIYLFTSLLGLLISMFAGPSRQGLYESSHGVRALLLGVGLGVAGAGSSWIVFMFFPAVFLLFAADRFGPVIALSPPGTRFPPIGAARQTLPNDVWQSRIREMAEGALCVVISATPYQINEGLDFELKMVDSELSHQRVLLVVGPWRKQTGQDRWRRFVAWTYRYSMFQPIAYPFVQPGAHVLAHTPSGWYAWGARRRTDRTYGACVDAALAQGLTEWAAV